jgi:pyruvate, orthophosphate dikinase
MTTQVAGRAKRSAPRTHRWIYDFSEGSREMREQLGGKGAGIAEMTRVLGPELVPAGFTITTEACVAYMRGSGAWPAGLKAQVEEALARLEERTGKRLGDPADPLLVSVRSGARASMPGMMDTVLNLGLNDESAAGLAARTGDERFAADCFRRLVQMFGNVVRGVPSERFEDEIARIKRERGVKLDTELDAAALHELTERFRSFFDFPSDPQQQLTEAIRAVFDSWMGERAVAYRRINRLPDEWGTAVNVQQMVYGNKGESSCSGVAFSRDEVTGASTPSGDFLPNAQGEDVVSGARTPRDLHELRAWMPEVADQLEEILRKLEAHYKDMQDTEFTVEEGRLFMLQTRSAKRPAQAAVRFAVDAFEERLLTKAEAVATIDSGALDALLHPSFDATARFTVLARGVAASPGAAKGTIVFTAPEAVAQAAEGKSVILVRPFTEADDVAGFHAAVGILTAEGGKASHAALVARGMGRPAVTGAAALDIDLKLGEVRIDDLVLHGGDFIAIDGTNGLITNDDVPLVEAHIDARFETILRWSDELRQVGVRANADTPEDATRAHRFGAEGIGLCRTEHMFMAADRQPKMRAMIMVRSLEETNPMLGTRGVRLGVMQPEVYEMQVRAIARAAVAVHERSGRTPKLEIMIPLVAYERELELVKGRVVEVAEEEGLSLGTDFGVGTMIELPRACFVADQIARHADFFSFGTNDLTQCGIGFSRDDIEGRIIPRYVEEKIVDGSPFATIDQAGVGELVRIAVEKGRRAQPELELGVCGEHGGDPESIRFFHDAGLDYVSCSPFRLPIARVAAAQAAIAAPR